MRDAGEERLDGIIVAMVAGDRDALFRRRR